MSIHSYQLHSYVLKEFNLTEQELFSDLSKEKRDVIINRVFAKFGRHRLFRCKLTNTKNTKDKFDNYQSFDHLKNFDKLAFDINYTQKQSKSRVERAKRKIHLARKQRFASRKRRRIADINHKQYKLKWQPKNSITKHRMERLQNLKDSEQNREFER